MNKCISCECNLADPGRRAFAEVGCTDFGAVVPRARAGRRAARGLHGAVSFTASLCGRYVVVTHGQIALVYELNHVCAPGRLAWSVPLRHRHGMPLGFLRPVTTIICPRRIISCSMDMSAGRVGMVCDVAAEGPTSSSSKPSSPPTSAESSGPASGSNSPGAAAKAAPRPCVCRERSLHRATVLEDGQRSVYRNLCHPDDPPRSVTICPQHNCVAFGCAADIELH